MADSDIFHEISTWDLVKRQEALDHARAAAAKVRCGLTVIYDRGRIASIVIDQSVPEGKVREYPHGK